MSALPSTPLPVQPLSVKPCTRDLQFEISGMTPGASWGEQYFNVSGYFGSYGPHVFAAAPDLLKQLQIAVRQNQHDMLMTGEELRACEAAIAKAKGQTS